MMMGGLLLAVLYFARPATFLLIPALTVLVPIVVVTTHWLGLNVQQVQSFRSIASGILIATVAGVAGPMSARDPDEWVPIVPVTAVAVVTIFSVYAIYARRALAYDIDGAVERLSVDGLRAHFTGYVAGLAAAIGAATIVETQLTISDKWPWSGAAFGIAFALGKLVADLVSPRPSPFRQASMSGALLRMTALSPLLWGLPWGIAYAGYDFVTFNSMRGGASWYDAESILSSVLHVAVAVTLVFAGLTILTFAQELFVFRRAQHDGKEEAFSSGDWARLFLGVLLLSFTAGLLIFRPLGPSHRELFGTETWRCARDGDEYKLGWIAREGVHITNVRGGFDFFNMSCVPRSKLRGGCKYDDDGWDEVVIAISGPTTSKTVTFNRRDPDMKYGGLYGNSALALLDALYQGSSAQMTIKAPKGRVLYVLQIDLKGFRPELDKCIAQWSKKPAPRR